MNAYNLTFKSLQKKAEVLNSAVFFMLTLEVRNLSFDLKKTFFICKDILSDWSFRNFIKSSFVFESK